MNLEVYNRELLEEELQHYQKLLEIHVGNRQNVEKSLAMQGPLSQGIDKINEFERIKENIEYVENNIHKIERLLERGEKEQTRQKSPIRQDLEYSSFLPEIPGLDWINWLRIVNPNSQQAQVQLIIRDKNGNAVETLETTILPYKVQEFEQSDLRSGLHYNQVYSFEIRSNCAICVERHQFDGEGKQYIVTPGSKPANKQIVPYFRKDWMNWVIIFNASDQENIVDVEIRVSASEITPQQLKQIFDSYEHKILSLEAFQNKSGYIIVRGTAPILIESHFHHPDSGQQYSLIGQSI